MTNKEEISQKCNEIIDLLDEFTLPEKYIVIKNLYFSFLDTCKREGYIIEEILGERK